MSHFFLFAYYLLYFDNMILTKNNLAKAIPLFLHWDKVQ